jgi:diguanylate cyclase (GGDEF)-like protein
MSAITEVGAAASRRRMMVLSAAVMFGGGTLVQLVESLIPGGQSFSLLPGASASVAVGVLVLFGKRLPQPALAALGPIGVAMIAASLASTNVQGDGAVLYMWPVLWEAYFFGWRGTVLIISCVAVAHGGALLVMEHGSGNLDRWIDVMSAVSVVGVVVELLSTRNQQLVARISEEARADELTRLLNRRGFDEGAARELARATRERSSIGVAAFDLDHFKRVNDEFGHEAGDQVLLRFADCLRSQARANDLIARMGGEEFLALLPGADLEQTRAFTERVRAMLRVPSVDPGIPPVTVSAGATAALAPENIDALLKRADMALYTAKSWGRDRTVVERPGADADSVIGLQVGEHGEDSPMVA